MNRNPSYSENQDRENFSQQQRGSYSIQPYQHYGNANQGNNYSQNQRYNQFQSQGQNRHDRYNRNQNQEDDFSSGYGSGYGLRQQDRWNQDQNYDYYQPERHYSRQNDLRGEYRSNSQRNNSGYEQRNDRNFGQDYGYSNPGNFRASGDYGRNQSDYGTSSRYGASRNVGSMGSYGGAQGYGSSSNGYSSDKWGSGHRGASFQPHHTVYGAYRDKNSFAPGERESYDGSQRSGSQGADNTRGWTNPGRSGRSGNYRHHTADEDSRYEIYDSALSQYNRGEYNNSTGNSPTTDPDMHSHQNYSPGKVYGSRQRGYRQGSGNDLDRHSGTSDMEYGQTGTPFESEAYPRNRYYDPQTGNAWNPGSEL